MSMQLQSLCYFGATFDASFWCFFGHSVHMLAGSCGTKNISFSTSWRKINVLQCEANYATSTYGTVS
jgi:hypothetical protein